MADSGHHLDKQDSPEPAVTLGRALMAELKEAGLRPSWSTAMTFVH